MLPNIPHCVFPVTFPIGFLSLEKIPLNSPGLPLTPFFMLIIEEFKRSPFFIERIFSVSLSVIG